MRDEENERTKRGPSTLSEREREIISVTMHVQEIAKEIQHSWAFLSQEKDRWGKTYNVKGALAVLLGQGAQERACVYSGKRQREKATMIQGIAEEISQFYTTMGQALQLGLQDHKDINQLLTNTRKYASNILNGTFMSYPDAKTLHL